MATYKIQLTDANEENQRTVEIVTDKHGFTVAMEGVEENLVLDLSDGQLRVFVTNEFGDVQEGQLGALGAPKFQHRYETICSDCKATLCTPDSVVFRYGRIAGSCESRLDCNGILQDVNSLIAQGLHIATSCRNCGHSLEAIA